MNTVLSLFIYVLLNTLLALAVAPFLMGLVKKVKALCQQRRGPRMLQPYYNLAKLMKKEVVYSSNSSWVVRVTPYVNMAAILVASLAVPLAFVPEWSFGLGNVVLFLYLLALAKFFMALCGLDAGSPFGGIGSSREMSLSALAEPIIMVTFAALALNLHTIDLHEMFRGIVSATSILDPAFVLVSISLFIILIIETSRVPVDNPETHLELTMVHEAMILEQSGKNLALMEWSHAVKQTVLTAVLVNVLMPWGLGLGIGVGNIAIGVLAFFGKAVVVTLFVGLFESALAKLRLFNIPHFLAVAFFLSVLAVILGVF